MFAKIRTTTSVGKTLAYNEQKLLQGRAECLLAVNFMKDLDQLSREDKLFHLRRLISLNDKAKMNTLHISVNFSPEDNLSNSQMQSLVKEYMHKTGLDLDHKPYLVYRHFDAAHPHLHVVGTTIQPNGKKMVLHHIIRKISPAVTTELEITHSLVKSEEARAQKNYLTENNAQKIKYGQMAVRPAITKILNKVLDLYKYASLPEFNAVLSLYNVRAERGKENSRLYQMRGLLYCVLNDQGQIVGSPIKASAFHNRPTLDNLEKKFTLNESQRQEHRQRLTVAIDWTLIRQLAPDIAAFKVAMQKEKISVVLQHEKSGALRNIFYIDHQSRAVFEGQALGERYMADAILRRCAQRLTPEQEQLLRQKLVLPPKQAETQAHRQRLNHRHLF